jgi:ppGpp synthetase/RelA/SpoT-type nucleotidyltranferase
LVVPFLAVTIPTTQRERFAASSKIETTTIHRRTMTNNTMPLSQHQRQSTPSLKRRLATVVFVATSTSLTPAVSAFGSSSGAIAFASKSSSSQVYYTLDENINMGHSHHDFFNPLLFQQQSLSPQAPQSLEGEKDILVSIPSLSSASTTTAAAAATQLEMPTWLRLSKAHLVHENMELLRQAMLQSFFSETEVLKLTFAIQEASNGNADKIAGAAEFCLIMVETMEMGLNALIAAAFHYCSCVDAREKSVLLPATSQADALTPWEFRPHQGIESFGEHAVQIERDAARLKRLEVVASMVIHNANHDSRRVTPDASAANNLRNLYTTEAKDWRALAIRGAACLYRLRGIIKMKSPAHRLSKESNRVCREALHIYAPLASRLGMHRLKNELEQAAFSILYKRQHKTVESLLHQTRDTQSIRSARRRAFPQQEEHQPDIGESMQHILTQVQTEMTEFLENDAVFSSSVTDFTVTARVKEGYSTWRKMLRNGWSHILQVPDALALRIVLNAKKDFDDESDAVTRARERALCYYAQRLCMSVWAPHKENPRFKDYIANPKKNGYQSLHYTASTPWHGEDWNMEIQVRSGEMHKVAEFGVASHWNYKAMAKPPKGKAGPRPSFYSKEDVNEHFGKVMANHNTDAYLRSLQEWHWYQHGSPVNQEPLVLFDEAVANSDMEEAVNQESLPLFETERRERAERIRARTERIAPYIEALTNEQSDLQRKSVFVFLSSSTNKDDLMAEGTVVALPAGAVVLDAIRECEVPEAEMAVKVMKHNGAPARLTSRLQNGDVLSIPSVTACVTSS